MPFLKIIFFISLGATVMYASVMHFDDVYAKMKFPDIDGNSFNDYNILKIFSVGEFEFAFVDQCNKQSEHFNCLGWHDKRYQNRINILEGYAFNTTRDTCNHEMFHLLSWRSGEWDHIFMQEYGEPDFEICQTVAEKAFEEGLVYTGDEDGSLVYMNNGKLTKL